MIRITEAWFEFKGKRSDDMGIRLRQMPTRGMPAERGKYEELPVFWGCRNEIVDDEVAHQLAEQTHKERKERKKK